MNKRGAALIICYMIIAFLSILAGAFLTRSVSERSVASKYFDSTQAFWLAEAGISRAMKDFRTNGSFQNVTSTELEPGGYNVTLVNSGKIRSRGFIPFGAPKVQRIIELNLPFYSAAIYAAGNIDIKGDAYTIEGDVVYAGTGPTPSPDSPDNIEGTVTHDPSISPLNLLKFAELAKISEEQGWYDPITHETTYPDDSYWYNETLRIPNVVYLEGDLKLNGGDNVYGFFVVGGEAICDVTIVGNVNVNGCIYTQGDFTVKGGGGALNISGAVWSGGDTNLNGSIDIDYNADYVAGLLKLGINTNYRKIWREVQNPY
jgi:hypothetical protein